MNKSDAYTFLLRCVIPEVTNKKQIPNGLKKSNLIWDCVFRAHRDVLTGRFHLKNYVNLSSDGRINNVDFRLYSLIKEYDDKNSQEFINQRELIRTLWDENREVGLGAIQKLVNMTFKYMVILKIYKICEFDYIDENNCDCPLDSIILKTLPEYKTETWTSLGADESDWEKYEKIQECISKIYKNRLIYDFKYYSSFQQ